VRRFAVDTNLYIDAVRSVEESGALDRFHAAFLPFIHLSAVVALELLAGADSNSVALVEREVVGPFERRGRVLTPSYGAYRAAARVLGALFRGGLEPARASRSLLNDALLAASCRESGMTLVTRDRGDFTRIGELLPGFEFVAPWPR
jgi:predicted nucleic acid-binding protein